MANAGEEDAQPKSERFNMFISKAEVEALNEWAWQNRIRSRSEAVRRLIQIGILAHTDYPSVSKATLKAHEAFRAFDDRLSKHALEVESGEDMAPFALNVLRILHDDYARLLLLEADAVIATMQLSTRILSLTGSDDLPNDMSALSKLKEEHEEFWEERKQVYERLAELRRID